MTRWAQHRQLEDLLRRFELREALALAESMVEQAGRGRPQAGATALALCALALVQTRKERTAEARATAGLQAEPGAAAKRAALQGRVATRALGPVALKGKAAAVEVFAVGAG